MSSDSTGASEPSSKPVTIDAVVEPTPMGSPPPPVASEPSSTSAAIEGVVEPTPMSSPPPAALESSRKPLKDITPVPEKTAPDKPMESGASSDVVLPLVVAGTDLTPGEDMGQDDHATGPDTMEDETVKDGLSPHPIDEDDVVVDDTVEMDAAADAKDGEEEAMEEDAVKADVPFGGVGAAFGSTSSWAAAASAFGQPSALPPGGGGVGGPPTTFGFGQPAESSSGSAPFLNIKPPGSSTAPPVFSFGATGSITLPTPSLPAAAASASSPFGAFGGGPSAPSAFGSSFGGGGGGPLLSSASSSTAVPLFGSPVFGAGSAAALGPPLGTAHDEGADEMEDGEGDMDAEA